MKNTSLFLVLLGSIFLAIWSLQYKPHTLDTTTKQLLADVISQNNELKEQVAELKTQLNEVRVRKLIVTSYSPCKKETDDDPFITASMQRVREGTVAVSRDLFYGGWVFGRQIYIEGYGIFVITDLMHERKTQQIDIFRFNTKEALKFGRKTLRVALLD